MLRKSVVMSMLCVTLALGSGASSLKAEAVNRENSQALCLSPSAVALKRNLTKLWIDHVVWTRLYLVSTIAGVGD
ncbi:hypothetical protein [Paenibacillus harenae]|uniref:hypothetical protein n=1 Tax=Paenibacillus harenae TaxID=306543 RepID=UPI00278F5ADD|nr:hypothetical protein [Paenibacillus harenae]MDQ0061762.1 hypothetical protein [Paenibacillus harenae]